MHALETAILSHTTATDVHHDWLIEDPTLTHPRANDARLWTARVAPPPVQWATLRRFDLKPIPPHRRIYLDYQGPVSGNRGYVQRLAKGKCFAKLWSEQRIVMTLACDTVKLDLTLTRQTSERWIAVVMR